MSTKTVRRTSSKMSKAALIFSQFLVLRDQVTMIGKRQKELKADLMDYVEQNGVVDEDKGHLTHTFPSAVEVNGVEYSGMMKQRKVSQFFLEDKAVQLCQSLGLDEESYTTRYVDQDKIVRLYADDVLDDSQFSGLYENKESWAFVPVKA